MAESERNGIERRIAYEVRFAEITFQLDRLVSDAESEKETRARANEDVRRNFDKIELVVEKLAKAMGNRMAAIERKLYYASGGLTVFIAISQLLINWYFKK